MPTKTKAKLKSQGTATVAKARKASASRKSTANITTKRPVKLLSGGNPQIAKADGDGPVQAYIDAMPGWKRDVGRWLDDVISKTVPNVQKAVKWNSPFYGIEAQGWFLGIHTFTNYVKVAFFRGSSLQPLPPGVSKSDDTRYLDIKQGDNLDVAQLRSWLKQAASLPGWKP
jgi:hypothetical protein